VKIQGGGKAYQGERHTGEGREKKKRALTDENGLPLQNFEGRENSKKGWCRAWGFRCRREGMHQPSSRKKIIFARCKGFVS